MGFKFPIYRKINPIIPGLLITFIVLKSHSPTVLQSYSLKVLQSYSPTVLQSYSLTVLQSYSPIVLLHRHTLRQIPRLVDITAAHDGYMIG
jgi:hypothetical protein